MKKTLLILSVLLLNAAHAAVNFWIEEETYGGFHYGLYYESDQAFAGFQLVVNGASNIMEFGGGVEDEFIITSVDSTIVGFSITGASIPAGSAQLYSFSSETEPVLNALSGILVTDDSGNELPVENGCAINEFHCHSGECIPEEFVCNDALDCSDNSDEMHCTSEDIFTFCYHPDGGPEFNVLDIIMMVNFILTGEDHVCHWSNLVYDNRIDIRDLALAVQLILGNGTVPCMSNAECINDDYACIPPAGDCDFATGPGECIEQGGGCWTDYVPVCGCDGETYSNECYANNLNGMGIAHEGECEGEACCIDPLSCNYDPNCNLDDDSCIYTSNFACDCFTEELCETGESCWMGDNVEGVVDCNGNCRTVYETNSSIGDGECFTDFDCPEFGYDCGDCNPDWDGSDPLGFCGDIYPSCCSDPYACNFTPEWCLNEDCIYPEDNGWCDCMGNTDCNIGAECTTVNGETGIFDCNENCRSIGFPDYLGNDECDCVIYIGGTAILCCEEFGYECGDCEDDWDYGDPLGFCEDAFGCLQGMGDLDGDGWFNIIDIVMLLNMLLNFEVPTQQQLFCSDVDGDGELTIDDIPCIIVGPTPDEFNPGTDSRDIIEFSVVDTAAEASNPDFVIPVDINIPAGNYIETVGFDLVFPLLTDISDASITGGLLQENGFTTNVSAVGNTVRIAAISLAGNILPEYDGRLFDLQLTAELPLINTPVQIENIHTNGGCTWPENTPLGNDGFLTVIDDCPWTGDVNGDGMYNILDVLDMTGFALELNTPTAEQLCAGDYDNDNQFTVHDIFVTCLEGNHGLPESAQRETIDFILQPDAVQNGSDLTFSMKMDIPENYDMNGFQFDIRFDGWDEVIVDDNPVFEYDGNYNPVISKNTLDNRLRVIGFDLTCSSVDDYSGDFLSFTVHNPYAVLPSQICIENSYADDGFGMAFYETTGNCIELEPLVEASLSFDCPESVTAESEGNVLPIDISASEDVFGIQFDIPFDPELIEFTNVTAGELLVEAHTWTVHQDSLLRIFSYNFDGFPCIPANSGNIFNLHYIILGDEGTDIQFEFIDVTISNNMGQQMVMDVSDECTIPIVDQPEVTLSFDCMDSVESGDEGVTLPINVSSNEDIYGIQVDILIDPEQIEITDVLAGVVLEQTFSWSIHGNDLLRIICLPLEESIFADSGTAFFIQFDVVGDVGDGIEFIFESTTMTADESGLPFNTDVSDECTVPIVDLTEVTLSFDCPESVVAGIDDNELTIYMENSEIVTGGIITLNTNLIGGISNINSAGGELLSNWSVSCNDNTAENGEIYCMFWSGTSLTIDPGNGSLFHFTFSPNTDIDELNFSITSAEIGNDNQNYEVDYLDNCTIPVTQPYADQCVELTGLHFPECGIPIGFGNWGGQCAQMYCSSIDGDDNDWSPWIYDTVEECEEACPQATVHFSLGALTEVNEGEDFLRDVIMDNNAGGAGGIQMTMQYDHDILDLTGVIPGAQYPPDWMLHENDGIILGYTFNATYLLMGENQQIFQLEYSALDEGFSIVCMDDIIVSDPNGQPYESTSSCGVVKVVEETDVTFYLGDINYSENTVEVWMNNSIDIAGIEIHFSGFTVGGGHGGSLQENGWVMTDAPGNGLIFYNIEGNVIPPGDALLANFELSTLTGDDICISNAIAADVSAQAVTVSIGDCVSYEVPTVFLSLENLDYGNQTIDIMIDSEEDVSGAQLTLTGLTISDVESELFEDCTYTTSFSDNTILTFGVMVACPQPQGLMYRVSFSEITADEICIVEPNITSGTGYPYPLVVDSGECYTIDLQYFNNILDGFAPEYETLSETTEYGHTATITIQSMDGGEFGDEIGVLDIGGSTGWGECPPQTGEVLVGAGVWRDEPLTITAYGAEEFCEDPVEGTGYLPGWNAGNPLVIKIWKSVENAVYDAWYDSDSGQLQWSNNEVLLPMLSPGTGVEHDVNLDQALNVVDIVLVIDIILSWWTPDWYVYSLADTNDDGLVNVQDIILMVNVILAR